MAEEEFNCKLNPQLEGIIAGFTVSIDVMIEPFSAALAVALDQTITINYADEFPFAAQLEVPLMPAIAMPKLALELGMPDLPALKIPKFGIDLPGIEIPGFNFGLDFVMPLIGIPLELFGMVLDGEIPDISIPAIALMLPLPELPALNLAFCLVGALEPVVALEPWKPPDEDEEKEETEEP